MWKAHSPENIILRPVLLLKPLSRNLILYRLSLAVALLSRWHSPRHTANEPISQRCYYFLKFYCDKCEQDHSQPRSKVVYDAMRQRFGELTLDPDTQRPILMSETAIFILLKARFTARKAAVLVSRRQYDSLQTITNPYPNAMHLTYNLQ